MVEHFLCPHCGAELATDATFCRECGASEDAGWGDDDDQYGPDDDFDYDEYVAREFPSHATKRPSLKGFLVAAVLFLLALAILLTSLLRY